MKLEALGCDLNARVISDLAQMYRSHFRIKHISFSGLPMNVIGYLSDEPIKQKPTHYKLFKSSKSRLGTIVMHIWKVDTK
jgi:hypothetical protein